MRFLKYAGMVSAAFVAACASSPHYLESDFVTTPIKVFGRVGTKSTSLKSGKEFEIYGICADGAQEYVIRQISTSAFGADGRWVVQTADGRSVTSDQIFHDRRAFLAALGSLEVVKRPEGLEGERRMRVAISQAATIPDQCEAMQARDSAEAANRANAEVEKTSSLIRDVVTRTGIQPMLTGRNEHDFNNLVTMFRRVGVDDFLGKFVWAKDGDYLISQAMQGEVVLTSLTNPSLFPPIRIITDKQALEGQAWSAVSRGPLEFMGPAIHQTAYGGTRQVLVFKAI